MTLINKKVLITGASRGLGAVIAADFASKGARITLMSRSIEDLQNVIESLVDPHLHLGLKLDLNEPKSISAAVDKALEFLNGIDVVVHAAGGGLGFKDPLLSNVELHKLFTLNLSGPAEINRLVCPEMIKNSSGNIVHIGSIASSEAVGSVGYNTVKAGLASYVRSLGKYLAPKKVIATGILPGGFISTGNAMDRFLKNNPIEYEEFVNKRLPRGMMGQATELLPMIRLLSSDEASMMCGCMVPIDAGEGVSYVQ